METLIEQLNRIIWEHRKTTSPLYQCILEGKATQRLLQEFIVHRYPVKALWTRHLLSIASRIDDYECRRLFLENAYEEETGAETKSRRHLESFVDVGVACGLSRDQCAKGSGLPETAKLCAHNQRACNDTNVHFTAGVASVIYLMEGQPPIVNTEGWSMERVMRDVYRLPAFGYEFFTHHASAQAESEGVSELEDEHALVCKTVLEKYCTTPALQAQAMDFTKSAIKLRHEHFDAIFRTAYDPKEAVFCYSPN